MLVYGPPLVVERLTVYEVAPLLAVQLNVTCALPAVAMRPPGAAGALIRVALACGELELVPDELVADTT